MQAQESDRMPLQEFTSWVREQAAVTEGYTYPSWWQELLERITDNDSYTLFANLRQVNNWLSEQSREASECQSNILHTVVRQASTKIKELAPPVDLVDQDWAIRDFLHAVATYSYDSPEARSACAVLRHIADLDEERVPE